jgi:hypothetical protein
MQDELIAELNATGFADIRKRTACVVSAIGSGTKCLYPILPV